MSRRQLFLLIFSILGLFALFKIYNTSFVSVTVEGTDSGSYSFSAIDKDGKLRKSITIDSDYARLRLPRGRYQIAVQHDNKSYFSVVDTRPFMSTSALTVKLTAEGSRQYVGNNPLACQHYFNRVMVSYSCGAIDGNIKIHVPATATVPTYSLPADLQVSGYVQGFVDTKQGTVGLVNVPDERAEGQAQNYYHLYLFDKHFKIAGQRLLTQLDSHKLYSIQPYGRGFVIYDTSLATAVTFDSFASKPKPLKLESSQVKGVSVLALDTYKDGGLSAYYAGTKPKSASEVVYQNGQATRHWRLPKTYQRVLVCDSQQLCALTKEHRLDIYDTGPSKPRLVYWLGGINDMADSGHGFLIVNQFGVVSYQAAQRSGYLAYSFGAYQFGDLQAGNQGFLVAIVGQDGSSVLAIDPAAPTRDAIDKQILAVRRESVVSNISVYGSHIFITANNGPLVYQSSIKSYAPDPITRRATTKTIQSAIDRAGIDRERYTIQIY